MKIKHFLIFALLLISSCNNKENDNYFINIKNKDINSGLINYIDNNKEELISESLPVLIIENPNNGFFNVKIYIVDYVSMVSANPPCNYTKIAGQTVLIYKEGCTSKIENRKKFFTELTKPVLKDDITGPYKGRSPDFTDYEFKEFTTRNSF